MNFGKAKYGQKAPAQWQFPCNCYLGRKKNYAKEVH